MKQSDPKFFSGEPPANSRLTLPKVIKDISADVSDAAFPDYAPELHDALAQRTVKEFDATAPHSIRPDDFIADAALKREFETADHALTAARDREMSHRACASQKRIVLVDTVPPPSRWRRASALAALVALGLLLAVGIGAFLGPTVHAYFFDGVFSDAVGERRSLELAIVVAGGLFLALCLGQLFAVIHWNGDVAHGRKALLFFTDLLAALAWGTQRLANGISPMALSIFLIELLATVIFTIALIGYASAVRARSASIDGHRAAKIGAAAADAAVRQAERDALDAERRCYKLLEIIAGREAAVRSADDRRTLTECTSRAAALIATARLAADAAENATADALISDLDALQAVRAATLINREKRKS